MQRLEDDLNCGRLTGNNEMARAIDCRNRYLPPVRSDGSRHTSFVSKDRRHSAVGGECPHQARPLGDEPQAGLQLEYARRFSRGIRTHTVAQDRMRLDAPRPPEFGHCAL